MQSAVQQSCVSARVIVLKIKHTPTWRLLWCLDFFSFNVGHLEGIFCRLLLRAVCFQKCAESLGQLGLLGLIQLFTIILVPVSGSVRSLLDAESVREDGSIASEGANRGTNLVKLPKMLIFCVHNHAEFVDIEVLNRFRTQCMLPQPLLPFIVERD